LNVTPGWNELGGLRETAEVQMRFLHQIVPIFFLVQFLVMLAAMVTAMLRANPEVSPLRRR
jgi:hypothetical protein